MPFAVTQTADLGLTSTALSVLPSFLSMHASGLDPLATLSSGTVYTILCGVFLELLIPVLFEVDIK